MGYSVRNLRDALERPAPPGSMTGRAPRIDRYPLRPQPRLPWLYRVDPLVLLIEIAVVVFVVGWIVSALP